MVCLRMGYPPTKRLRVSSERRIALEPLQWIGPAVWCRKMKGSVLARVGSFSPVALPDAAGVAVCSPRRPTISTPVMPQRSAALSVQCSVVNWRLSFVDQATNFQHPYAPIGRSPANDRFGEVETTYLGIAVPEAVPDTSGDARFGNGGNMVHARWMQDLIGRNCFDESGAVYWSHFSRAQFTGVNWAVHAASLYCERPDQWSNQPGSLHFDFASMKNCMRRPALTTLGSRSHF